MGFAEITRDDSQIDAPKIAQFMRKRQEIYRLFSLKRKICGTPPLHFKLQ